MKLSAASWDEMVKVMSKHVMENHPDVAKQMEQMHNEDPKKWGREMKHSTRTVPELEQREPVVRTPSNSAEMGYAAGEET